MYPINKYLLILLAFMPALQSSAQLRRADRKFDALAYAPAIKLYHKALKKDPTNWHVITRLADSYRLTSDSKNAEYWYSRVAKNKSTQAINLLHYGQALMNNEKWEDAVPWITQYQDAVPGDPIGESMLRSAQNYRDFMKDSSLYNVRIANINTEEADWGPAFRQNEVVFASARKEGRFTFSWTGRAFLDLYASEYRGRPDLGDPVRLKGKVNSKLHEGGVTFSPDGNTMYFSRNNIYRGKIGSSKEGVILLKTYRADWNGKKWRKITGIPFNDDHYSVGHPALSHDGKILYFVSDMEGGEGGTDIWMVKVDLENNEYGKPVNLGPQINTPGNEMFPWVDKYNTLYFASNGHMGLGGLDIFSCKGWNTSEPDLQNMGYPINSARDDFDLIFDEKRGVGYFSSNRTNGEGDDDIYTFTRRQVFRGKVVDAATGEPIENARFEIYDVSKLQSLGRTDEKGQTTQGIYPNRDYKVVVSKDGYTEKSEVISTRNTPITKDVVLTVPLEKTADCEQIYTLDGIVKNMDGGLLPGTKVKLVVKEQLLVADEDGKISAELLPNKDYVITVDDPVHRDKVYEVTTVGKDPSAPVPVEIILAESDSVRPFYIIYYNFDMHNIRPGDARPELDKVVAYMKRKPGIKVLLTSHTDCRGSNAYNERLSKNRAIEAYEYITSHGIAKDRLRYDWKGEKELTNHCKDGVECTPEEHQENRRTEFRLDGSVYEKK
jgi:outer membrane protein OmpA-like peptidoglycan-associated protein/tetratricopeptide (TPR) repeat protein